MNSIKELFRRSITQKIIVILLVILFIYATRKMLNLFLLTFMFTYLMYSLHSYITKKINKYFKINPLFITVFLYVVFGVIIVLVVHKYFPVVILQSRDIIREIQNFRLDPQGYSFYKYLLPIYEYVDIKHYVGNSPNYLFHFAGSISKWGFNILAALMLSMFFLFEKSKIKEFLGGFKTSKVSWAYNYLEYIGQNFLNSFGKVMQAQILIAIANTVLSIIALSIMNFPHLIGLGVMIFILSLIPVVGVIISLVPLTIIAFDIGGMIKVAYIIGVVIVIHAIGSYFLTPKFMSDKTKLPVFFIFIVLIIAEHYMGVWGLLIGLPLFMFFLDLIDVTVKEGQ